MTCTKEGEFLLTRQKEITFTSQYKLMQSEVHKKEISSPRTILAVNLALYPSCQLLAFTVVDGYATAGPQS